MSKSSKILNINFKGVIYADIVVKLEGHKKP